MLGNVDRHIRAGAVAGIVYPAIWSSLLLFNAPEWRSPFVLFLTILLGLVAGACAGGIAWGFEKLVSRRIPIVLSVIVASMASLFITAIFTSAQ